MKNSKKNFFKTIKATAIVFALIATTSLSAQPGFNDNVQDVPLDAGLIALLIGAAAYGIKKLRDNKQ